VAQSDPWIRKNGPEKNMSGIRKFENEPIEKVVHDLIEGKYDSYNEIGSALKWVNINHYRFSLGELKEIVKKEIWWRTPGTIAHHLASLGFTFTIEELIFFANPTCRSDWTVAHEMAKNGHNFTLDELVKLKNPVDNRGLSVADIMIINGYRFTNSENDKLEIDTELFDYSAYASFDLKEYFRIEPKQPTNCPICGKDLTRSDVEISKLVDSCLDSDPIPAYYYSYLFLCHQCHWWCVRERWAECERGYDGDVILVGIAKKRKNDSCSESNPWEKALANEYAYDHDLVMLDEIFRMFPDFQEKGI
jgi:hypothetical protein